MNRLHGLGFGAGLAVAALTVCAFRGNSTSKYEVVITGGHQTDPRDHGRPVVLVAGALGVSPDVFGAAFSRVHPAPAGSRPDPADVRENKRVLLEALSSYGITNERLDEVSNYYRYRPQAGEMWPIKPAKAEAIVSGGKVTGIRVVDGGSGYSSPPVIRIAGTPYTGAALLKFGSDFRSNGSISQIKLKQ